MGELRKYDEWVSKELKFLSQDTTISSKILSDWYLVRDSYAQAAESLKVKPKPPPLDKLRQMRKELNQEPYRRLSAATARNVKYYEYLQSDVKKTEYPNAGHQSLYRWERQDVEPLRTPAESSGLNDVIRNQIFQKRKQNNEG